MKHWRAELLCGLLAFGVYLTGNLVNWGLKGWPGRGDFGVRVVFPLSLLTLVAVAIALARRAGRHPILTSSFVSGAAVCAAWIVQIPLTLVLPGLIQRDHAAWVSSAIIEGAMMGGAAALVAAIVASGTRLAMHLWRRRSALHA